jgi:hypothetical protein
MSMLEWSAFFGTALTGSMISLLLFPRGGDRCAENFGRGGRFYQLTPISCTQVPFLSCPNGVRECGFSDDLRIGKVAFPDVRS